METVNIVLSIEVYELVKKALVSKLAGLNESSEEYRKLWDATGEIFRAEWINSPSRHVKASSQDQPASSLANNNTTFKPVLPPLSNYQPSAPANQSGSDIRVISPKQAGRFYGIGKKSNKRPSEITAKLSSMGISNYKEIPVGKYDELINWLQA